MSIIQLSNVDKTYGVGEASVRALRNITLTINSGEMVAIMGRSGSGKSTLLNVLGGLTKIDRGNYYFDGGLLDYSSPDKFSRFRRQNIGFIVQHYALIDNYTVYENIALPLHYSGLPKRQISERVNRVLSKMEIADKQHRYPAELSGGQRQRTAIARAIVNDARIILADEPTGALDADTEAVIMQHFMSLNNEGKTIVIVTHDSEISKLCNRTVCLRDGILN